MSTLPELQDLLGRIRAERNDILGQVVALDRQIADEPDAQAVDLLQQQIGSLRNEADLLRRRELDGPAQELQPQQFVDQLEGDMPILLAPLRVQTRFANGQDGRVLLIRVYPDDFSVQTHDAELAAAERVAGDAYWAAPVDKPDDQTLSRIELWRGMFATYGAPRASYIRETTNPDNVAAAVPAASRQAAIWTLPERLVFRCIGIGGLLLGDEVVGQPIPDGLEAGFDPTQLAGGFTRPIDDAGDYDVPPELAWQYDFDAAVRVGMAVRIPLQQLGNPRSIKRIVVLGVRLSSDPKGSADLLARLVDDHRFTEGFEFVPQGTPTNITHEGEVRATLDADAVDALIGGPASFDPPPSSTLYKSEPDGLRLARALGLDGNAFARVPFASQKDGSEAIAMKCALWSGTLGYYAQQMMAPLFEGLNEHDDQTAAERLLLKARFYFTTFVFGRGPLPAIRVGNQPYGVLPVSADMLGPMTPGFAAWNDDYVDEFMTALHGKLQVLVPTWRELANNQVATVAAGRIAEVLSLQASAVEFRTSRLVGKDYLKNYVDFKDKATADAEVPKYLNLLKTRWDFFNAQFAGLFGVQPRIFDLSHFGGLWRRIVADVNQFDRTQSPLLPGDVIDDLPLSESRMIGDAYPNYIAALSKLDFEAVRRGLARSDGKPMTALLYLLLRHSYLYEHAFTAMRLVHRGNGMPWLAFREKEIVNVGYAFDTTYWDILGQSGAVQIDLPPFFNVSLTPLELIRRRDELRTLLPWADDYLGDIDELQHSLTLLAELPTARLERLFAEHLDLCSYRLDAWLTGFVYQRLLGQRLLSNPDAIHPLHASSDDNSPLRYDLNRRPLETASRGLFLGAYGIVEGLEVDGPMADPPGIPVADLPTALTPKNGGVVTRDPDNFGFIHAPSLNHAVTAAILRSGSVSEPGTAAFNINLSSSRTRDALWMIEGIRNGQLPAALLGYRFERGLREADPGLQKFLPALRFAFPMPHPAETQPDDPKEVITTHDVVNGLAIVQAQRGGKLDATLTAMNPGLSNHAVTVMVALASALNELLDACADLMLAESVHQAAQGNFARAGAAVTSAGEFTHVPDRFDVVDTPRTGTTLTHRVLLAFDPAAHAGGVDTPRARLAPALNTWLASLFGPLPQLQCVIAYRSEAATPEAYDMVLRTNLTPSLASFTITLDQLGLAAIDVLFLLDDAHGTELAQRADLIARPLFDAVHPGVEPARIELQLFAPAPAGQRVVGELMPLASQLRRLLAQARSATRRDLLAPKMLHDVSASRSALDSIDAVAVRFDVLGTRQGSPDLNPTSLMLAAQAAADALAVIVPANTEAEIENLLLRAAAFGMPEAVPTLSRDPDRLSALQKQAVRVQLALQARIDAAKVQSTPEALAADLLAACSEAAKTLLGTTLPLLPTIQISEDLSAASLPAGKPDVQSVEDWLFAASLVRPGAERLQHARVLAAAVGSPLDNPIVLQWPATAKSWIAEPPPTGEDWNDDRVAIAIQPAMPFELAQPLQALVLDEWTELLPRESETTGIAFHYDAPNAEPPQALLLAVSARSYDNNGRWMWRELVGCVEQAFDLVRLRAVDPDELRKTPLDTVLPATMMAESAVPVTVSTSLIMLAADQLATSQAKLWSMT